MCLYSQRHSQHGNPFPFHTATYISIHFVENNNNHYYTSICQLNAIKHNMWINSIWLVQYRSQKYLRYIPLLSSWYISCLWRCTHAHFQTTINRSLQVCQSAINYIRDMNSFRIISHSLVEFGFIFGFLSFHIFVFQNLNELHIGIWCVQSRPPFGMNVVIVSSFHPHKKMSNINFVGFLLVFESDLAIDSFVGYCWS